VYGPVSRYLMGGHRLLAESKSGKQALREVCDAPLSVSVLILTVGLQFAAMAFGVLCMFLVA
jgi:hypothetical protein